MSCAPTCPRLLNRATPLNPANIAGSPRPRTFLPKHGSNLETKFAELCANPEYQKAVKSSGLMPQFQTGKAFSEIIGREGEQAKKILEASGLLK